MGRIVRSADSRHRSPIENKIEIGKAGFQADIVGSDSTEDNSKNNSELQREDGYLERVAKFVPAEIVAFFIFVNLIVSDALEKSVSKTEAVNRSGESIQRALNNTFMGVFSLNFVAWSTLAIAFAMVPLYLFNARTPGDKTEHVWLNIAISMLAFPVWAYAVDAVAFRHVHDGALASISLATFSIISGAISPEITSKIASALGFKNAI